MEKAPNYRACNPLQIRETLVRQVLEVLDKPVLLVPIGDRVAKRIVRRDARLELETHERPVAKTMRLDRARDELGAHPHILAPEAVPAQMHPGIHQTLRLL